MAVDIKMLTSLEEATTSPRDLALLRISLAKDGDGFAALFVPLLKNALDSWLMSMNELLSLVEGTGQEEKKHNEGSVAESVVSSLETSSILCRLLQVHVAVSRLDGTLAEEIGRQGSHALLSRLMQYDGTRWEREEDQDSIMELQDLACEVASGGPFPLKAAPFTVEEVRLRLPLAFDIEPVCDAAQDETTDSCRQVVLINQVSERQSAQEDVGFVMWPSAVALSQWLVTNPHIVRGRNVMELGAGCGLTGLVAAGLDCSNVVLTDCNPKVLENVECNISLNNLEASVMALDFYQQSGDSKGRWIDMHGESHPAVDVILAADMICQPSDAVAAANTVHDALLPGGLAVVVCADAKHRFGVDQFESSCRNAGLTVRMFSNVADLYDGRLVSKGMDLTTGYVEGMTLTMYHIEHIR